MSIVVTLGAQIMLEDGGANIRFSTLALHGQDDQHPAKTQLQYFTALTIDFTDNKNKQNIT